MSERHHYLQHPLPSPLSPVSFSIHILLLAGGWWWVAASNFIKRTEGASNGSSQSPPEMMIISIFLNVLRCWTSRRRRRRVLRVACERGGAEQVGSCGRVECVQELLAEEHNMNMFSFL